MSMRDVRQGVRLLWRSPGFTVTAVLTLALGIGATTAIFSAVNAVLLNPFPYRDVPAIMRISERAKDSNDVWAVPYPDFLDWRKQQTSFSGFAAIRGHGFTLTGTGEPAQVQAAAFSAEMVPLLGVEPLLGRGFRQDEDREGADRVVLLGHRFWQDRFGSDPRAVGRTLTLDNQTYTIVGVMPPRFVLWGAELWVPIGLNFEGEFQKGRVARTGNFVLARLARGLTLAQARAEMTVIMRRIAAQYPETHKNMDARVDPLLEMVVNDIRPTLLVLLGAVGFLLLIACANVANLMLARAATRRKEMAVRLALGASRGRLLQQVIVECLPLALLGASAGLFLAYAITQAVVALMPEGSIPAESRIQIDWRVLLFAIAVSLGATLLCALMGAWPRTARSASALKDEGRGATGGRDRRRLGNALVVVEVALSLMLLAGAGLLIASFQRLQQVAPGFSTTNILRLTVNLPPTKYADRARAEAFFTQALERLQQVPGVRIASAINSPPFSDTGNGMPIVTEGSHYDSIQALPFGQYTIIMGDYFRAMGIPLRRGRVFDSRDRVGTTPVVVINDALARRHFPGKDPIGQRILLGLPDNLNRPGVLPKGFERFPWSTVVGVVGDTRKWGLNQDMPPEAYVPYAQAPDVLFFNNNLFFVIQTTTDPLTIAQAARAQIWSIDRDQPIVGVTTMTEAVARSLKQPRFSMLVLLAFASVAVLLAAVGIYGVMSYSVLLRTREVGIRMALGAERGHVLTTMLSEGAGLAGLGLLTGLAGAFVVSRVLRTMLFQISPTDPTTYVVVAVVLGTVALVACYVPARRATRVDPLTALRCE
jgi:putative ABC transport system permease protein